MRFFAEPRRRWFAYGVLAMVACATVLAAGLVLSGAYNVAASATHFYITDRLLKLALWRSVDTQSAGIEVPPLDDPGLVQLGARHFATGCQPCHAGPGLLQNPVAGAPSPPPWQPEHDSFVAISSAAKANAPPAPVPVNSA